MLSHGTVRDLLQSLLIQRLGQHVEGAGLDQPRALGSVVTRDKTDQDRRLAAVTPSGKDRHRVRARDPKVDHQNADRPGLQDLTGLVAVSGPEDCQFVFLEDISDYGTNGRITVHDKS